MNPDNERTMLKPLESRDQKIDISQMKKNSMVILSVYVVLILLGLGTGYMLVQNGVGGSSTGTKGSTMVSNEKVVGVKDASKYTNCPTGTLEKEGLDGEGTHHLVRPGGPSQTAYLVSSIIDLDQYVGMTVKLCGTTMQAQRAPWLMDVERLEILAK